MEVEVSLNIAVPFLRELVGNDGNDRTQVFVPQIPPLGGYGNEGTDGSETSGNDSGTDRGKWTC